MHSAHDEWRAWTAAVTQRDVDRVLRRVNRRIETGVVALPKGSRCLEDDHSWIEADVALEPDFTAPCKVHETTHATPRGTLVFLHGFGDDAGTLEGVHRAVSAGNTGRLRRRPPRGAES
jgi:hypothetical protein